MIAVFPVGWYATLRLGSVQQILESIRAGQPCTADVVCTDSPDDISMLKSAWSTFAFRVDFRLSLVDRRSTHKKLFLTRLGLSIEARVLPALKILACLVLGTDSPWIQPLKVISQTRITNVQRLTVRATVLSRYRCVFTDLRTDSVKDVIADMAVRPVFAVINSLVAVGRSRIMARKGTTCSHGCASPRVLRRP